MRRREVIKYGALGGAAVAFAGNRGLAVLGGKAAAGPGVPPFSVAMPVPPVLRPTRRTLTTDYYTVTTRESTAEIFPGIATKVLGYEGAFLGPTIRAWSGREVKITHVNALPAAAARRPKMAGHAHGGSGGGHAAALMNPNDTVVHLHGGHTPADSDGHPKDTIAPGAQRLYTYPNEQAAATLWYHDHGHVTEGEHLYRGLAGFYLLSDLEELALGLPSGDRDVPIMLRDAAFDDAGQLTYVMGDFAPRTTILVNGKPQPYFKVKAARYRFRVLNAANERVFGLRLDPAAEMVQVGSDGGLLAAPIPASSVLLSPGERVDLVIDFSAFEPGTRVVLHNDVGREDSTKTVMAFDVQGPARDHSRVPRRLRRRGEVELGAADVTRRIVMTLNLELGRWEMDGKVFDMDRIDQYIRFGDTEIWQVDNPGMNPPIPHNLHLHGVHFQVLDRDGKPVEGHETGWKDTVYVAAGSSVRIKVRFDRHKGLYPYHCHFVDHSSMGMMAQMEIRD